MYVCTCCCRWIESVHATDIDWFAGMGFNHALNVNLSMVVCELQRYCCLFTLLLLRINVCQTICISSPRSRTRKERQQQPYVLCVYSICLWCYLIFWMCFKGWTKNTTLMPQLRVYTKMFHTNASCIYPCILFNWKKTTIYFSKCKRRKNME